MQNIEIKPVQLDLGILIAMTKGGDADPMGRYMRIATMKQPPIYSGHNNHVFSALQDCWFIGRGVVELLRTNPDIDIDKPATIKNLCVPAKSVSDDTWKGIRSELSHVLERNTILRYVTPQHVTLNGTIADYSESAEKIIKKHKRQQKLIQSYDDEHDCISKTAKQRHGCPAQLQTMVEHVMAFSTNLWPQYFEE